MSLACWPLARFGNSMLSPANMVRQAVTKRIQDSSCLRQRSNLNQRGRFVKSMRRLAGVYTHHDPQPSNPNQVMVIMFSVELGAVDEPHRHLKSFMKGRRLLQFR